MHKASAHINKGDYNSAILELKKAAQIDADNPLIRSKLGEAYLRTGNLKSAEKEFDLAIRHGLKDKDTLKGYGDSLLSQQKYRKLLEEPLFQQANDNAYQEIVLILYGNAHAGLGEYELAVKSFEGALLLNQDSIGAHIGLAKIALQNDRTERAEQLIGRILQIDGQNHDAYLLQAAILSRREDLSGAEQAYEKILTNNDSQILTPQTFQAYVNIIFLQIKKGDLQKARRYQEDFHGISRRHPVSNYLDALIAYQQQDYQRAQQQLQITIKALPEHMPTVFLFGATNYALGNHEQANIYLSKFVNRNPTHIPARKLLAATLYKLKKPNEALLTLNDALPNAGEDKQLLMMASMAAIAVGDNQAGIRYFRHAQELDPGNNIIREQLARLLLQQNDTVQAIELLSAQESHSDNSLLLLVQAHTQKGEFDKARGRISEAMASRGKTPQLHALLGIVNMASGARSNAIRSFKEALEIDSGYIPAKLYLARLELENGNLSEAEIYFNQIVISQSDNSAAMFGLAQIAEMRGDYDHALGWLKKSTAANPNDKIPLLALGYYYLRTQEYESALATAKSANAVVNDISTSLLLARAYSANKDYKASSAILEQLVVQYRQYLFLHAELANVYMQQDMHDLARKQLLQAHAIEPDNATILVSLAKLETENGDRQQAQSWIDKLIGLNPRSPQGYELKGDLSSRHADYANALKYYNQALSRQATPAVYLKLADLYARQKDNQAAVNLLKQANKAFPEEERILLVLATILQKMGQDVASREYYNALLEINSDNVVVLNNLAYSYIKDDLGKSMDYARRAYQLAPNSHAVIDTLGWVLIQSGQPGEGIAYLEKIVNEASHPSISYHYAVGLYNLSDIPGARKILTRLLEQEQAIAFPERADASALLQKLN